MSVEWTAGCPIDDAKPQHPRRKQTSQVLTKTNVEWDQNARKCHSAELRKSCCPRTIVISSRPPALTPACSTFSEPSKWPAHVLSWRTLCCSCLGWMKLCRYQGGLTQLRRSWPDCAVFLPTKKLPLWWLKTRSTTQTIHELFRSLFRQNPPRIWGWWRSVAEPRVSLCLLELHRRPPAIRRTAQTGRQFLQASYPFQIDRQLPQRRPTAANEEKRQVIGCHRHSRTSVTHEGLALFWVRPHPHMCARQPDGAAASLGLSVCSNQLEGQIWEGFIWSDNKRPFSLCFAPLVFTVCWAHKHRSGKCREKNNKKAKLKSLQLYGVRAFPKWDHPTSLVGGWTQPVLLLMLAWGKLQKAIASISANGTPCLTGTIINLCADFYANANWPIAKKWYMRDRVLLWQKYLKCPSATFGCLHSGKIFNVAWPPWSCNIEKVVEGVVHDIQIKHQNARTITGISPKLSFQKANKSTKVHSKWGKFWIFMCNLT